MTSIDTKQAEFNLSGVSVLIAMPVNRDLPWQTAQSLVTTTLELARRNIKFAVQFVVGSSIVEVARNKVAHEFLRTDMTRLLMIDSDMRWTASDVIRMLALSTKMQVVTAAYTAKREPATILMQPEPGAIECNEWGCLPVRGLGLGFTIVTREVIATLAHHAPKVRYPEAEEAMAHIFRCDTVDGDFRGEDMAFFADVREQLGLTVWLDPLIDLGHVGGKEYRGRFRDALRAA